MVTFKLKGSKVAPAELTIDITISHNDPSRVLKIETQLSGTMMKELIGFLRMNLDVFAWTHSDMRVISPTIASPSNIDLRHVTVKQKQHGMNPEGFATLKEEVRKLKNIGLPETPSTENGYPEKS